MASSELAYKGILCTPGYNLGGKALVRVDGKKHRILLLNAESEQDPLTVAVSLDAKMTSKPSLGSNHRLQATCSWGSKSGNGVVTFDVRHGCRMTLDASHITIDVTMPGTAPDEVEYLVTSSITYGSVTGPSTLTFTEQPVLVNAGAASAKFAIPSYARRIAIYADATAATREAVLYTSDNGAATPIMRIPCTNGMEPVSLPNGVEFVEIVNTAAVLNATFTLFYELVI